MIEKSKLKDQVELVLKTNEDARNCDTRLMLLVWQRYYPTDYYSLLKGNVGSIYQLPQRDNVNRFRRKFNEEGKYYPTKEEVARARNINIDDWRRALGYSSESIDQMKML